MIIIFLMVMSLPLLGIFVVQPWIYRRKLTVFLEERNLVLRYKQSCKPFNQEARPNSPFYDLYWYIPGLFSKKFETIICTDKHANVKTYHLIIFNNYSFYIFLNITFYDENFKILREI